MSEFKIDPFFPDKNLNPQGWITDFITSRMERSGKQRSDLANLIYDEVLTDETVNNFKIPDELKKKIQQSRTVNEKDKSIYLNPLYYDAPERNASITAKVLEDQASYADYYKKMINLGPSDLSKLVPYIKIKFGYKKPADKTFIETDVPFQQNLNKEVEAILADQFSRGQGAGIQKISAERSFPAMGLILNINLTVTYFFSSISLLTKQIITNNIPEEQKFSYSKLFSFLPTKRQKLFLEYGYGADSNSGMENIIQAEKKRIALAYKSHRLNVQEDGTITIDVTYLAESEAQYHQKNDVSAPSFDYLKKIQDESLKSVFSNYVTLNQQYYKVQKDLRDFTEEQVELQQIGAASVKQQLQKIKKQIEVKKRQSVEISKQLLIIKERTAPYIKELFINSIIERNQMFSISFASEFVDPAFNIYTTLNLISKDDKQQQTFIPLKTFETTKSVNDFKDFDISVLKDNELGVDKQLLFKEILKNLFDGVDRAQGSKQFGYLTFFPLKALISIVYEFLPNETEEISLYKTPITCFGNVVARSFNREYSVNIGDVLIEINTFKNWLHRNFIQKNRVEYSFSAFMDDIIEDLIPEALYRNNTGFYRQNSIGSIRHLNYFTNLKPNNEKIKNLYHKTVDFAELRKLFTTEKSKEAQPMIYYSQMLNPINEYASPYHKKYIAKKTANNENFSADIDSQFGIPHVIIGSSKGLIKKVSFNAMEQPFLATSLVMQSMADGNTTLPRYAYNITVDMFGNNLFNHAGFLAVPPFGIESGIDTSLGFTGYYVVTKVSDSLSIDGGYSTSVTAIWHDNPLFKKQKTATLKSSRYLSKITTKSKNPNQKTNTEPQDLKEYIDFTVSDYIEDLLELDAATLKALGLTAKAAEQEKRSEEKKNDPKDKKKKPKEKPKKK